MNTINWVKTVGYGSDYMESKKGWKRYCGLCDVDVDDDDDDEDDDDVVVVVVVDDNYVVDLKIAFYIESIWVGVNWSRWGGME